MSCSNLAPFFTSLNKGSIVIMKKFDFKISPEISVLSLPEPILTIFGMTSVCVCGFADVRMCGCSYPA
ncbi:hypothetical protein O3M35_012993 [Rhynocoris fuscipes]|uniref:Uncharacterized protein n=1 Tax=Rhynocoris fuscipes TaxID=488301 RepID=A0AAW1CKN3_9HEMI